MKNIRFFYLKNFHFSVIKFSVYLNRHVFVMVNFDSYLPATYPYLDLHCLPICLNGTLGIN